MNKFGYCLKQIFFFFFFYLCFENEDFSACFIFISYFYAVDTLSNLYYLLTAIAFVFFFYILFYAKAFLLKIPKALRKKPEAKLVLVMSSACGVIVIVVENGHGDSSSNPGQD